MSSSSIPIILNVNGDSIFENADSADSLQFSLAKRAPLSAMVNDSINASVTNAPVESRCGHVGVFAVLQIVLLLVGLSTSVPALLVWYRLIQKKRCQPVEIFLVGISITDALYMLLFFIISPVYGVLRCEGITIHSYFLRVRKGAFVPSIDLVGNLSTYFIMALATVRAVCIVRPFLARMLMTRRWQLAMLWTILSFVTTACLPDFLIYINYAWPYLEKMSLITDSYMKFYTIAFEIVPLCIMPAAWVACGYGIYRKSIGASKLNQSSEPFSKTAVSVALPSYDAMAAVKWRRNTSRQDGNNDVDDEEILARRGTSSTNVSSDDNSDDEHADTNPSISRNDDIIRAKVNYKNTRTASLPEDKKISFIEKLLTRQMTMPAQKRTLKTSKAPSLQDEEAVQSSISQCSCQCSCSSCDSLSCSSAVQLERNPQLESTLSEGETATKSSQTQVQVSFDVPKESEDNNQTIKNEDSSTTRAGNSNLSINEPEYKERLSLIASAHSHYKRVSNRLQTLRQSQQQWLNLVTSMNRKDTKLLILVTVICFSYLFCNSVTMVILVSDNTSLELFPSRISKFVLHDVANSLVLLFHVMNTFIYCMCNDKFLKQWRRVMHCKK